MLSTPWRPSFPAFLTMNYRHAFHAGNFADVLKHSVLTLCLERLKAKPAPFRVIDTHAGIGLYDLGSDAARRTSEWRDGIERIRLAKRPEPVEAVLKPYLAAIEATQAFHGANAYPGSPELARHLTRAEDRLLLVEKHPVDAATLAKAMAFDGRAKVLEMDGYLGLNAFLPPKERRGLVLIDPPFEETDEFETLLSAFLKAHRKWPTGQYMIWYPIKTLHAVRAFHEALAETGIPKILRIELTVKPPAATDGGVETGLAGSGLILVNPPWRIDEDMAVLLPWLDKVLAQHPGHGWRCDWIARDAVAGGDVA